MSARQRTGDERQVIRQAVVMAPPTDEVVVYRLRTEAITWVNAVALQAGRLDRRSGGSELKLSNPIDLDVLRADLHFFVVALSRLRRCVTRAGARVPTLREPLALEVGAFDATVPWLQKVRNVAEHIDEYNLDEGRNPSVRRQQVQVWSLGKSPGGSLIWTWLGENIDIGAADDAGVRLYRAFEATTSEWLGAASHDVDSSPNRSDPNETSVGSP